MSSIAFVSETFPRHFNNFNSSRTIHSPAAMAMQSMWAGKSIVEVGDLVILFETHNSVTYAYMEKDGVYHNRHGAFHHNDMIGQRFGTKVYSRMSKGYIFILSPTSELWSKALRHRTQIVFTLDASAILFNTHCCPGKIVIESGTGSGALTTSFARAVQPNGHVYTFEFNATRAKVAKEEFDANGLSKVATIECRDACEQGFPEQLDGKVDIVFLDLPCPWKAVGHAKRALKAGGAFASYSPCMEQVQRTCDALRVDGFDRIRTIETRLMTYCSRTVPLPVPNFGFDDQTTTPEQVESNDAQVGEKRKLEEDSAAQGHTFAKRDDEMRGHTAFLTFAYKF
ncbi:tRNA (adenine-N(1)-)-methyltransferase catalytic subunit [Thraustotheca clavata]|uniref:tRNA (adenine(58)-N(1))-methyltransferase n=1 Tax=Thraustotheca clavata TaxID=74557 RepID=A0A1V9ZMU4_9STRA|nr:tRNA (adenine-N(1)-)-methyltransferase catalytic subunit [Thraustotheca clavata]